MNEEYNYIMSICETDFQFVIKEMVNLSSEGSIMPAPEWNMAHNMPSGRELQKTIQLALLDKTLRQLYQTNEAIEGTIYRFIDRYLINQSFKGDLKYSPREVRKIYTRWSKEVFSDQLEIVVMASVLNIEVNRVVNIGDFELIPIIKSGKVLDLEKNILKLLGFRGVKDIRPVNEYSQYHHSYFFGGNALRIKGSFPKRSDFYQYPSLPENGSQELQKKISDFVTILRLFKEGDFVLGSYHYSTVSPFTPGEMQIGERKYNNGLQYPLVDKNEIMRLRKFTHKFLPVVEKLDQLPLPIQIGVEYLNSSYEKVKMHEKFIDLMIALDSLIGVEAEASFRLAIRAACFLTKSKDARKDIHRKIKEATTLRGKLIHGNEHPNRINQGEIEQNRRNIENTVRTLIVQLLNMHTMGLIDKNYKQEFDINFVL